MRTVRDRLRVPGGRERRGTVARDPLAVDEEVDRLDAAVVGRGRAQADRALDDAGERLGDRHGRLYRVAAVSVGELELRSQAGSDAEVVRVVVEDPAGDERLVPVLEQEAVVGDGGVHPALDEGGEVEALPADR